MMRDAEMWVPFNCAAGAALSPALEWPLIDQHQDGGGHDDDDDNDHDDDDDDDNVDDDNNNGHDGNGDHDESDKNDDSWLSLRRTALIFFAFW